MKVYSVLAASCAAVALSSCGPSVDGPQSSDIDGFLEMELPEGIDADAIEIQAAQNVGDEIEPAYRTRAKLTLELEEDYAERVDRIGDRPVIKITREKGTQLPAVLFTRSEPIGDDDWSIELERLEWKRIDGSPVSMFEDPIIEGSEEEKQAREAAKKEAAEEERKQKAEIAAAQKAFVGNWKASQPLKSRGSVYVSRGKQIGMSFNLGPNTDGFGKGTGRVYDFNNPQVEAKNDITYTVSEDGQKATVTFLDRTQHPDLPWYISANSNFTLNQQGEVSTGRRDRWTIKMSK